MSITPLKLPGLTGHLEAVESGAGHKTPIVSLHGWLDNANSFRPMMPYIPDRPWVSLDLPGHGLSAHRPKDSVYHLMDYTIDLDLAIEALKWPTVDIVAHSLGAGIATLFAAVRPERIRRLVLLDGIGPLTSPPERGPDQLTKLMDVRQKYVDLESKTRSGYENWDQLINARMLAGKLSKESASLLMRRNAFEEDGRIYLRTDSRLKHPSPVYMTEPQVKAFAESVSCPVMLVQAEQGLLSKISLLQQRIDYFKDMTVNKIAGHHHVHMDDPGTVSAEIRKFLDS